MQNTDSKKNRNVLIAAILILLGVIAFSLFKESPPEPQATETHIADARAPQQKAPLAPEPSQAPKPAIKAPPAAEKSKPTQTPTEEPTQQPSFEPQNFVLCEHIVSGESQYEFTGQIRLINKGATTVSGWSVTWEYEDDSSILSATDVALSGSNPYTGEYLSWNADLEPGKTVTFSFVGLKGGDTAPLRVDVTGDICI
ncbi:Cellulose binding domain-containing protein [Alteromonadaceae bacterium Bs31]|nr:Cellulose binding domain-containing protein [Alteromonadaceae bacterium Bs31]